MVTNRINRIRSGKRYRMNFEAWDARTERSHQAVNDSMRYLDRFIDADENGPFTMTPSSMIEHAAMPM